MNIMFLLFIFQSIAACFSRIRISEFTFMFGFILVVVVVVVAWWLDYVIIIICVECISDLVSFVLFFYIWFVNLQSARGQICVLVF